MRGSSPPNKLATLSGEWGLYAGRDLGRRNEKGGVCVSTIRTFLGPPVIDISWVAQAYPYSSSS